MIKHLEKLLLLGTVLALFISCGSSNSKSSSSQVEDTKRQEQVQVYGEVGKSKVAFEVYEEDGGVVYYPENISKEHPTPVVFLEAGWFTDKLQPSEHNSSTMYKTLIEFVVSHGVTLIYAPTKKSDSNVETFIKLTKRDDVLPYIDTSRIGVIGHSSGGGHTYYDIKKLSEQGWGTTGRFVLACDPWFAFGMKKEDLQTLPTNTNIIIQKFSKNQSTDPRITLTTYSLLDSIVDSQKDYQVYEDANHSYVQDYTRYEAVSKKSISQIKYVLKPLDALMAYTFKSQETAKKLALDLGSDNPIADKIEEVKAKELYQYGCKNDYIGKLINYCEILP